MTEGLNEVEAITGLIALRTTIDTLEGLKQNEEEFDEEQREKLADAHEVMEEWMEESKEAAKPEQ